MLRLRTGLIASLLFSLFSIQAGCNRPDSADATARENNNTPVFFDESGLPSGGATNAEINELTEAELAAIPSFVRSPHFAVVKLNLRDVAQHPDFADVPWSDLEKQYAALVGETNSDINDVESVWLLLDGAKILEMGGGSTPWTIVIEYSSSVDETALKEAQAALMDNSSGNEEEVEGLASMEMEYHLVDETTLVVGSEEAVDVVVNGAAPGNDMIRRFATLDLEKDVAALMTVAPIRSTLQSFVDLAASFGGDEVAKFSDLPEVVHSLQLSMDLDQEQLLRAVINIEDDELGKELTRLISGAINSSAGGPAGGGPAAGLMGSLGGMSGGFPGMGMDDGPPMLEPAAGDAIAAVGREIQERDLIEVRNLPGEVIFTMGRPETLKDAVIASVEDGYKQFELITRASRMEQIGAALKAYHEDHERLPPAGAVLTDEAEAAGVPAQLNWRTALLPYMDLQELHDRFDYSLAWDHENNLAVAADIPDVFATEATLMETEGERPNGCRIFYPAGTDALFQGNDSSAPKLDEISDRTIWTAIVVEGAGSSATPWTGSGSIDVDNTNEDEFGVDEENGVLIIDASFKMRAVRRGEGRLASTFTVSGDENFTRRDFIQIQTDFEQ
ncbi:MAG: DUF1559 domain-containing protein [Planctomycetota bacterium]